MRRIGVYGGAFDPVHMGDVRVVREAMRQLSLDELLIIPFQASRGSNTTPRRDRLNMLTLAFTDMQDISIVEEEYPGTPDGLTEMLRYVRDSRLHAIFYLIMSTDQLAGWLAQRNGLRVLRSCNVVLFTRAGSMTQDARLKAMALNVRVSILQMKAITASAGVARQLVAQLDDAPDILPQQVAEYIALNGLYNPPYAEKMRSHMSAKRYQHSLGVRDTAVHLARLHGASMQKASVAGMLHDCAKCMPLGQLKAIARRYKADNNQTYQTNALLHGPVGAEIARVTYKITDKDVLNAIRWHTVGRAGMSRLELCVYVADAIEPNRKPYPQLEEIRALAQKDLVAAALQAMLATRDYVLATGQGYCADSVEAIGDLTERVR